MKFFRKRIVDFTLDDLLSAVVFWYVLFALWVIIINGLANMLNSGLDDSDKDAYHRSGVSVVTDYKTGIQYLKSPEGFLTPRLGNYK